MSALSDDVFIPSAEPVRHPELEEALAIERIRYGAHGLKTGQGDGKMRISMLDAALRFELELEREAEEAARGHIAYG